MNNTVKIHTKLSDDHLSKALDTLELIKWLNFESKEMYEIYSDFKDEPPELIITTHWITYINDRMKKTDKIVWKNWANFFGSLIMEYQLNIKNFENFNQFKGELENIRSRIPKKVPRMYPQDWGNIVYTLWILGKFYNKSFIKFLDLIFKHCKIRESNSEMQLLGFILSLLSYSATNKLGDLNPFHKELTSFFKILSFEELSKQDQLFSYKNLNWKKWFKDKRYNSKRLMACLRDFIRFNFFIEQFQKLKTQKEEFYPSLFSIWFYLNLNDLELPGDRWNERFFLPAILKVCYFKVSRFDNASRMTREIYDTIKKLAKKENFIKSSKDFKYYPIDVDFSYWFAKNFCDINKCNTCPFGPKGFNCDSHNDKCNFFEDTEIKCIGTEICPIFNKKGMGMCGLCF